MTPALLGVGVADYVRTDRMLAPTLPLETRPTPGVKLGLGEGRTERR